VGILRSIGPEIYVALVTGIWFIVSGISLIRYRPPTGRRAHPVAGWIIVTRRLRGVLEFLGGLAVIGLAAVTVLNLNFPPIGLPLGLGLAALALWSAVEAWVPPLRWVKIILSILGFALAVFFAGFR
jgi:hypothetical protein